jgi:hypothetical protein
MIQGFWHVSFTVSDIEAAVKWYTEVLGLEYVRGQEQANEYTAKLRNCVCPVKPSRCRAITLNWCNTYIRAARTSR